MNSLWDFLRLLLNWRREDRQYNSPKARLRHSDAVGDYVITDVGVWTKDGFVPEKKYVPPLPKPPTAFPGGPNF